MLDRIASFGLLVMSRLPCRSWCPPSRAENCPWRALYIGAVQRMTRAVTVVHEPCCWCVEPCCYRVEP